jgi:hypothetical protein
MVACHFGLPRDGNDLLSPLRALKPQEDTVGVRSYLETQGALAFFERPSRISKQICFFRNSARQRLQR